MTDQRMRTVSYMVTALGAGILVGGLFAPRAGQDSRKLIARKAQRVKRTVKNAVDDSTRYLTRRGAIVRDRTSDLINRGKGVYRIAEKVVHAAL